MAPTRSYSGVSLSPPPLHHLRHVDSSVRNHWNLPSTKCNRYSFSKHVPPIFYKNQIQHTNMMSQNVMQVAYLTYIILVPKMWMLHPWLPGSISFSTLRIESPTSHDSKGSGDTNKSCCLARCFPPIWVIWAMSLEISRNLLMFFFMYVSWVKSVYGPCIWNLLCSAVSNAVSDCIMSLNSGYSWLPADPNTLLLWSITCCACCVVIAPNPSTYCTGKTVFHSVLATTELGITFWTSYGI